MKKVVLFIMYICISTLILAQNKLHMLNDYSGGVSANISLDGKSVIGSKSPNGIGQCFLWSTETETGEIIANGKSCQVFKISNNRVIVGNYVDSSLVIGDNVLYSGGYYKNGQWYKLDSIPGFSVLSPEHASRPSGISADGTVIAGYAYKQVNISVREVPTVWHENSFFSNIFDSIGVIRCVSADGTIFGGSLRTDGGMNPPVIYSSEGIDTIRLNGELKNGQVNFISSNNRYAAVRIESYAALYEIATKTLTIIPKHEGAVNGYALSVSDNGIVVGYSQGFGPMGIPPQAFIYGQQFGFKDLRAFVQEYLLDIDVSALTSNSGFYMALSISSDGYSIVGHAPTTSSPYSTTPWVLIMDPALISFCERPQNTSTTVTDNTSVTMTWEAPLPNAGAPEITVLGYDIYRDDVKINSSQITELIYTDNAPTVGYPKYSIVAIWSDGCESPKSDPAEAMIVDNYNIPFTEVFIRPEYRDNFWTLENGVNSNWIKSNHMEGLLPYCMFYLSPVGEVYSDSFVSKKLDATSISDLELAYSINVEAIDSNDKMSVEVFDGTNWITVKEYNGGSGIGTWMFEKVDIASVSSGHIINIRFRANSTGITNSGLWYLDNIKVYSKADEIIYSEPLDIFTSKIETPANNTYVRWTDPSGEATLTYMNAIWVSPTVGNEGVTFIAVNSFKKEEIIGYDGYILDKVKFYSHQQSQIAPAQYNFVIYEDDVRVYEEVFTNVINGWNIKYLGISHTINALKSLKIGFEMIHEVDDAPIAIDYGPVKAGKGNLYSEDGGNTWNQLPVQLNGNWAIIGILTKPDFINGQTPPALIGYNIYRDDVKVNQNIIESFSYYYDTGATSSAHCYFVETVYDHGYISEASNISCTTVDVELIEKSNDDFYVYPNPANNVINIKGEYVKSVLLNTMGIIVLENDNNKVINIENLPEGMYILKIYTTDRGVISKKIIIKK